MSAAHDSGKRLGRGSYFFLSYAHSPPLAGNLDADPDQWVRRFFHDLTESVKRHTTPRAHLTPGFFDQDIPLGSDWKASLTRGLSSAAVFVPLYSPGYFARSWPGREWACFHQRMRTTGLSDPLTRFAPVLWIPLPQGEEQPGLREALTLGATEPAYAENGLRALLRLTPYRDVYAAILDRLASRIVELAESAPLEPSAIPEIDETPSAFPPEDGPAVFAVTVAAPTVTSLPPGRERTFYGDGSMHWRPFPRQQELSLATYAEAIAERLGFAVVVDGIDKATPGGPGVVLIDPWFAAGEPGASKLRTFVANLPRWVLPLLVLNSPDDSQATRLALQVRDILGSATEARAEAARRAIEGVNSLKDFVSLMPKLVTEAERQYLRHGPGPRYPARPGRRPRLSASPRTQPPEDKDD